jgi:hypothetical protein
MLPLNSNGSLSPDSRPTTDGIDMSSRSSCPSVLVLEKPGLLARIRPADELEAPVAFWSTMLVSVTVDDIGKNAVYGLECAINTFTLSLESHMTRKAADKSDIAVSRRLHVPSKYYPHLVLRPAQTRVRVHTSVT